MGSCRRYIACYFLFFSAQFLTVKNLHPEAPDTQNANEVEDTNDLINDNENKGNIYETEEIKEILKKFDVNNDGKFSDIELDVAHTELSAAIEKQKIRKNHADNTDEKNAKVVKDKQSKYTWKYWFILLGSTLVVCVLVSSLMQNRFRFMQNSHQTVNMQNVREARLSRLCGQDARQSNAASVTSEEKKLQQMLEREYKQEDAKDERIQNKSFKSEAPSENLRNLHEKILKKKDLNTIKSKSEVLPEVDSELREENESCISIVDNVSQVEVNTNSLSASNVVEHLDDDEDDVKNRDLVNGTSEIMNNLTLITKNVFKEPKDASKELKNTTSIDQNNLRSFLATVLDSKVEVGELKKLYRLGLLQLHHQDLPSSVAEVEGKMTLIFQLILPRQLSKMGFIINCYNQSTELEHKYNDLIVEAASEWLKTFVLNTAMDILIESFAVEDNDLWSDFISWDTGTEAVTFLWRLAGWAPDGVNASSALLNQMLRHEKSAQLVTLLVKAAGNHLKAVERIDEIILNEGRTLRSLEILFDLPMFGSVLAKVFQNEVTEAADNLGNYFERNSIFGTVLSLSTIQKNPTSPQWKTASTPFLDKFPPSNQDDLQIIENMVHEVLHRCQNLVYSANKRVISQKSNRKHALEWLASVIRMNELRTTTFVQNESQIEATCSDGYMLNFCCVLLEFFLPMYGNQEKLEKVDLTYCTAEDCRLNYDFETCLAGGQIVSEKQDQLSPSKLQAAKEQFNFITECYHLLQRALNVGVVPTISHYNALHRAYVNKMEGLKGTPKAKALKSHHLLLTLMWDTCLMEPDFVRKVTMFYVTQAQVVLKLIQDTGKNVSNEAQKRKLQQKALAKLPEFQIKDMANWFSFLATHVLHVHRGVVHGISLVPFVDCCVMLLQRSDLMPGPIAASKIVTVLLHFVDSNRRQTHGIDSWGSGLLSDLAAMVHTCPSVQQKLGPALLHIYSAVDVVEGLDVDKDEFDKYAARSAIGKLIENLWSRVDCRTSIIEQCDTEMFQNFLGSVLDTLLYMLHDSLARLANVKQMESAREDESAWSALSENERAEKESFLQSEEHVAKAFMMHSDQTLEFICLLTMADEVSQCFTQLPLAQRAASAICGFLEALCGAKSKDFKVKNMERFQFSPAQLLVQIISLITRISRLETSRTAGYLASMATDPDFELQNLEKALAVIEKKKLLEDSALQEFRGIVTELQRMHETKMVQFGVTKNEEEQWESKVVLQEIDKEELVKTYTNALSSARFDIAEIQESHNFLGNIQHLDAASAKVKALMKEMKQLQQNLPVHPEAAIFVCQDEERIDMMRALVTGPTETPYSLGCFVFDIYFPSTYPNNPPLVKLITTGNGTVRFNPNLYSDGKVCLSLLGTWHAGNASEKWNSTKSSLYQSMIFIADPMFNEPGYEGMRGTVEGEVQSKKYNQKIRLWTIRHAMLRQLQTPPPGLAAIIKRHFRLQKNVVLKQCCLWLQDCEDEDEKRRLKATVEDLKEQLETLSGDGEQD